MSYRLVDKQILYAGKRARFEIHHLEDEETGRKLQREVVAHPGAVVILAFGPDGKVILIRNRRYTINQHLLELPAGGLNADEEPMNCAGRELLEETGFLAGRLRSLGSFYTSPGILGEKMFAYAAYDLEQGERSLEEGEEIDLHPLELDEALDMIGTGDIQDGKTIATLLMYDRFFRAGDAVSREADGR